MKSSPIAIKRWFITKVILITTLYIGMSNPTLSAQVSGIVWLDNNANGQQDADETSFAQTIPGFGAPNMALYPTGSTDLIDFIVLDEESNGHYIFENVSNGNYYVCMSKEFLVVGLTVTIPNTGNDSIDSDFDVSPCSYEIVVSDDQHVSRDLGLTGDSAPVDPGNPNDPIDPDTNNEISGIVWLDDNGDGLRNNNESVFAQTVPGFGAPNIAIYPSGSIEPIAVSSLDENSNGRYRFEIPDGDYYMCVSNEFRVLGLSPTIQNAGDDGIDSDFDGSPCTYGISVTEPDTQQRDFGLVGESNIPAEPDASSQISGFVWLDNNADGLQNNDESGFVQIVPNFGPMTVALYPEGSIDAIEVVFLDEGSNGRYLFEDVPAGDYYICTNTVFYQLGLSVTTPNTSDDSIDSDFDFSPCSYDISVTSGQVISRDLGLIGELPAPDGSQISGFVWIDTNQNMRIDDNENGVGAVVEIYALPEKVGSLVKHIASDGSGFYEFTNLPVGEYRVRVIGSSVTSITTRVSDDNANITIDFPVDSGSSPIKVDGSSCTLENALILRIFGVNNGGCAGAGAIILESGSNHLLGGIPRPTQERRLPRFPYNAVIDIYGNGAHIDGISSGSADSSPYTGLGVLLTNVAIDSVRSGAARFSFSHAEVGDISATHDASEVRLSHSKIENVFGGFSFRVNLFSSIVTGNAALASAVNSSIEGTLTAFLFGSQIIDSSVSNLVIPKFGGSNHTIENSTIGGVFINNSIYRAPSSQGNSVEECFNDERVLDPQCLLDLNTGG